MKVFFKGRTLRLVTKFRRLPNGRRKILEMIEHPGAVLIVPLLNSQSALILRQFRPSIDRYLYEFPAGTINAHETPLACARRELIEETGHRAAAFTKLNVIYPVPGYSDEVITLFKAQHLTPQQGTQDDDEFIRVLPKSRAELKRLFYSGKIRDAKTIAALAFMRWL